jgi:hypothetical protein
MIKPVYERQKNRHIAVTNISAILAEIRAAYPTETLKSLADKVGVREASIKRWQRLSKARRMEADALMSAYPVPPVAIPINETANSTHNVQAMSLMEFFILIDKLKAMADSLRTQIDVHNQEDLCR